MTLPPKGLGQLRKGRQSQTGRNYFITKSALQRLAEDEPAEQGILMGEGIPELIGESLQWLHNKEYIYLLAYVVMPDHIHILFNLGQEKSLSRVMQQFGNFTGRRIAAKLGRAGSVWQESYYDRALRDELELEQAYGYIVQNPVKAGYVHEPEEWPWLYGPNRE